MPRRHDQEYKTLFSNRQYLKELLESFVLEPWVKHLDFETAQKIDKTFITKELQEREADLIWKVKLQGRDIYVYLLLEFQSKVDRFMALRVLRYLCEFYQSLLETQKLDRLPSVFPLVLYNGDGKWTAPERMEELIDERAGIEYAPKFRYFKLAENEISDERLWEVGNAVSALFLVEKSDPWEIQAKEARLLEILGKEPGSETVVLLMRFLSRYLGQGNRKEYEAIEGKVEALEEVKDMLSTNLKKWQDKLRDEGREEGREEGRQDGLLETARKMKAAGYDTKTIQEMTGLTSQDIERI